MPIFDTMLAHDYEQLVVCTDKASGLRAFICIHDTTLGPALGGVRIWPHKTEEDALTDVLRLARAMTYKAAAAGLSLGGGKALIVADPRKDKSEALLRAYGRFVEAVGGRYITTEDVGSTTDDMEIIATQTRHVIGLPVAQGGGGDPSPMTGFGVFRAMQACAKDVWGNPSLQGRTVAVQGFGKVASNLAAHLKRDGARLIVTDINEQAADRARREFDARLVAPDDVFDAACDIFAPCALGGALNDATIPRLRCKVVCGAANNQLAEDRHGEALMKRGILYAPDFIVSAGGVINLSMELMPLGYNEEMARERTSRIYGTLEKVIGVSKAEGIPTSRAAERLAEERVGGARAVKRIWLPH